jgi:hypothetical protein
LKDFQSGARKDPTMSAMAALAIIKQNFYSLVHHSRGAQKTKAMKWFLLGALMRVSQVRLTPLPCKKK